MTADEAIAAARAALREPPAVQATALPVTRLDVAGQCYWLVILGDDDAVVGVAAIAEDTGAVMAAARVGGRRHLDVNAARAIELARMGQASAHLVWRPCQASLSPLYPFWRVTGARRTRFVDQREKCWDWLPQARA